MTPGNLRIMQGAASRKMHSILKIRAITGHCLSFRWIESFYMKKD